MSAKYFLNVPYLAKLDKPVMPGQSLIVHGIPGGKKFDINLATGPQVENYKGDKVALHVTWSPELKQIVLDSMENGNWQKREKHDASIKAGEPLYLRITAHDDRFEVFLQGKKYPDFIYRLPLKDINYVYVTGDVKLQVLGFEAKHYQVPYRRLITGLFSSGKKLFVVGVPTGDKFSINLYAGSDIAFHFNPRLPEKVVVLNSKKSTGAWEQEQRETKFQFAKKKQFDVAIVSEGDTLQVYVDGEYHSSFKNRVNSKDIDGLGVEGDVELLAVAFDKL